LTGYLFYQKGRIYVARNSYIVEMSVAIESRILSNFDKILMPLMAEEGLFFISKALSSLLSNIPMKLMHKNI